MENQGQSQSVIDSQVEIIGTIKTQGSLRLDGKLKGDLECGGDAVIGKTAHVEGNLNVNSVSVAGTINGNINAKDRIEMKSSARVMGDIKSKRLAVEDGVTFIGKSEVNPTGAGSAPSSGARELGAAESEAGRQEKESRTGVFARK